VTPETPLRWYRQLIAQKWNYADRRGPGRPRVIRTVVDLIIRMACDNPSWGYTRHPGPWDFRMICFERLVLVGNALRRFADGHQVQDQSLLCAPVLQKGFSAHVSGTVLLHELSNLAPMKG
jgi:hypothetical protein